MNAITCATYTRLLHNVRNSKNTLNPKTSCSVFCCEEYTFSLATYMHAWFQTTVADFFLFIRLKKRNALESSSFNLLILSESVSLLVEEETVSEFK